MTLPTSGPLTLQDIVNEFGGTPPHWLSEYYGAASGVPASGPLWISDFYGKSSSIRLNLGVGQTSQPDVDFRGNPTGVTLYYRGLANGIGTSGSFGSLSPNTLLGRPITQLYVVWKSGDSVSLVRPSLYIRWPSGIPAFQGVSIPGIGYFPYAAPTPANPTFQIWNISAGQAASLTSGPVEFFI